MGHRGPRKQPGKREKNGQLSRRVAEVASRYYEKLDREETMTIAVAVATREQMFALGKDQSRDQKAGSYIGRLCLAGEVTAKQYDAAMLYAAQSHAYSIAMRSPPEPNAVNLNATKGGNGDWENIDKSQSIYKQFETALKVLQRANAELANRGSNLIGALNAIVLRDQALDHLIGDARIALNVLVRHYGLHRDVEQARIPKPAPLLDAF